MVKNGIPRQRHAVLLALLLGINLGHWLPGLIAEPQVRVHVVEVPAQRTRPVEGLAEQMRVRTAEDAAAVRAEIQAAIFGGALPASLPVAVEDAEALGVAGERLTMALPSGDLLEGYLLRAEGAERLAIYHAGHGQHALTDGAETIRTLLAAGFDVLALDMPPEPHDLYAALPRPLETFVRPIAEALNYALAQRDYRRVIMTGLSGGGWSTVLYAALDPRIEASFPVAGSYPFFLRDQQPKSRGDYEQTLPWLDVGYLDLYLMATDGGREQLQFFNRHDPCCFAGDLSLTYREPLHRMAAQIGGLLDVVIDDEALHVVSRRVARMVAAFGMQD